MQKVDEVASHTVWVSQTPLEPVHSESQLKSSNYSTTTLSSNYVLAT